MPLFGHFPVLVKFDYDSVQLCVCNYPVYLSSCLFSLFSSGLLITPGVPVCLPCLVLPCLVYIKDCHFEFTPRLRVPHSSLLCAP